MLHREFVGVDDSGTISYSLGQIHRQSIAVMVSAPYLCAPNEFVGVLWLVCTVETIFSQSVFSPDVKRVSASIYSLTLK